MFKQLALACSIMSLAHIQASSANFYAPGRHATYGGDPLVAFAYAGDIQGLKLRLEHNATHANDHDNNGLSLLALAAIGGFTSQCNGAQVEDAPLFSVTYREKTIDAITYLIARGADKTTTDKKGLTAYEHLFNALQEHEQKLDILSKTRVDSALQLLCYEDQQENLRPLKKQRQK